MREEFKVKIYSKNQSSEVQKILFKFGFSWNGWDKKIQLTDKRGLFFDLKDMTITYTDYVDYYVKFKCRKITLKKLKSKTFQNLLMKKVILKRLEQT